MAQCPAGYYNAGNVSGVAYCDGNWCNPINPFSGNSYQQHVYIHCVHSNGSTTDVYSHTNKISCC